MRNSINNCLIVRVGGCQAIVLICLCGLGLRQGWQGVRNCNVWDSYRYPESAERNKMRELYKQFLDCFVRADARLLISLDLEHGWRRMNRECEICNM